MSNAPCVSSEYFTDCCSNRNSSSLIFTGCLPASRFTREISETGELVVKNRGDASVIETFPDAPLDND